jgi:aspartyl-tRNA(Asn)/glutamyl-tRNA(Gln) amidotransferase subunit B
MARAKRFVSAYGLTAEQAGLLCEEAELASFFEDAVKAAVSPAAALKEIAAKTAALLLGDVKHLWTKEGIGTAQIGKAKLSPVRLASLVALLARGAVSAKNAKQTLQAVFAEDKDPEVLIREHGWEQLTDPVLIGKAVDDVLAAEAATAAELVEAKAATNEKRIKTLTSYLAGKVIAATGGRADPSIVGKTLAEKLI